MRGFQGIYDLKFPVTIFWSHAAEKKREEVHTLHTLARRVTNMSARTKAELPWLKLAKFGDAMTSQGKPTAQQQRARDQRHRGRLRCGKIAGSEVAETLEKAGVLAMVYTSPSHTEDAPRWRPTSQEFLPDRREKFLGRLNGLLRGIVAGESWMLSQAYYYGSANHNLAHQAHIIEDVSAIAPFRSDAIRPGHLVLRLPPEWRV